MSDPKRAKSRPAWDTFLGLVSSLSGDTEEALKRVPAATLPPRLTKLIDQDPDLAGELAEFIVGLFSAGHGTFTAITSGGAAAESIGGVSTLTDCGSPIRVAGASETFDEGTLDVCRGLLSTLGNRGPE